ncbi:MAG: hypothetical protein Kow0031_37250 [Anaerolineae bacterium]
MHQNLFKLSKVMISLVMAGLFGIATILVGGLNRTVPAAYAAGESCFVSLNNSGTTDYQSVDASAVQTAINAATAGDLIKVAGTCAGVTQTAGITQTAYISQNLTLQGGYTTTNWLGTPDPETYPTVLDAEGNGRVVYILSSAEVTLAGLTIQHGLHSNVGGGIVNQGVLTVTNSRVLSNTATNDGGGIDNGFNGLTVINSLIQGNTANRSGGIRNYVGEVTIISTTLAHNTANTGQGGAIGNDAGALNLIDSLLQHNQAATNGGGVYGSGSSAGTVISNTHFYSNTATADGGGFYLARDLVMTNSLLSENYSGDQGGAGYLTGGIVVTLDTSTILSNTAVTGGGGLFIINLGPLTSTLSTIAGNQSINGGGLYIDGNGTTVILDETSIYSNSASSLGGGIFSTTTRL